MIDTLARERTSVLRLLDHLAQVAILFAVSAHLCIGASLTEVATFGSNPGQLRMFKYVPDGLSPGAALVVALHGCRETAAQYLTESGWQELAERWRFAVVLPQQEALLNPIHCFNWFNGDNPVDWWWPGDDQDRDKGEALSIKQWSTPCARSMRPMHAVSL